MSPAVPRKTALPEDTLLLPGAGAEPPADLPEYDWDEILRHNTPRDLWLVVGGHIYNVGEFMFHHPGGAEIMLAHHGHDATDAFLKIGHPEYALALTRSFLVGRLRPGARPPARFVPIPGAAAAPPEPQEIPVAIDKLRLDGERFLNFDIFNDVRSQLAYCRQHGHVYQVALPGEKPRRMVVVSDAELLDAVASDTEQFGKQVEGVNFFTQLSIARGSGISVVSDSPFYERVRRIMIPWYSPQHQRTQFERMKEVAQRTVTAWAAMPASKPFDMRDWMTRYALEISGRGACSYDFGLLTLDAKPGPLATGVPACLREAVARVAEPAPDRKRLFGDAERRERSRAFHAQADAIFREAEKIVDTRQHMQLVGEQTDLLGRLLTEPDPETGERLGPDVIRDQILMHLSNGFNGPSVTLSWLPVALSAHPEAEARLIAEIDAIAGGDPDYDMQYADLLTMTYATQVIKETLRLYPPMPVTVRNSLKDGRLGPWRMREGDIVLVGTLAAHHDPRHWGAHPERFDPDNFSVERVAARARHAFIPFSVGQRQCMAQEVTFMMLRVALFHFYSAYRLRLAPGAKVATRAVVTMSPVAVPVIAERREDKAARQAALAAAAAAAALRAPPPAAKATDRSWDVPSAIPVISPFGHATIAFGSNFGSTRDLAEQLAEKSRRFGFTHDIMPLNALTETEEPQKPWLLMVCTATYTGNPPSNANKFKAWLQQSEAGCARWRNCRYVVFGLGNSQWVAFQRFPRFVHERLRELGATPLLEPGSADVGSPVWSDDFASWTDRMWPQALALAGAKPSAATAIALDEDQREPRALAAMPTREGLAASLDGQILAPVRRPSTLDIAAQPARVLAANELHAPGAPGSTRHIELALPPGFGYRVGDHVGVCPRNDEAMVERLARRLDAPLDGLFRVPEAMRRVRCVPRGVVLQVGHALRNLVDIAGPISTGLIGALEECAEDEGERALLGEMAQALAGGEAEGRAGQLLASRFSAAELLDLFPSARLTFFRFLECVPPLRPRYYSASSSPAFHGEGRVHITVGRLDAALPGPGERNFRGLCSGYLHGVPDAGSVDIFLDKAEGFWMQDDVAAPMLMISAGTGFAPMRAFLFERLALRERGATLGAAVLFNGIRSAAADFIYRDELEMFQARGVLDALHVATSRDGAEREYVQHKLLQQAASVWRLLNAGAYVFICGSVAMRSDVRATFARIAVAEGGMSETAAEAWLAHLEQVENRYRPDVWG